MAVAGTLAPSLKHNLTENAVGVLYTHFPSSVSVILGHCD